MYNKNISLLCLCTFISGASGGACVVTPGPHKLAAWFGGSTPFNKTSVYTGLSPANAPSAHALNNDSNNKEQATIQTMMRNNAAKTMGGKVARGIQNAAEKHASTTDASLQQVMEFVTKTVTKVCVSYEVEVRELQGKLETEVRKRKRAEHQFQKLKRTIAGTSGSRGLAVAESHRAQVDELLGGEYNSGAVVWYRVCCCFY